MTFSQAADRQIRRAALVVAVMCIALVVGTAAFPVWSPPRSSSGYRVGEGIDVPRAWYAEAAGPVVLLFVRHDCPVCESAAPVVTELRARLGGRGIPVGLVAPDRDAEAERAFAEQLGFGPDQTHVADLGSIRLSTVPTVVLVDREGTVLYESRVPVDPEAGQALLAELVRIVGA